MDRHQRTSLSETEADMCFLPSAMYPRLVMTIYPWNRRLRICSRSSHHAGIQQRGPPHIIQFMKPPSCQKELQCSWQRVSRNDLRVQVWTTILPRSTTSNPCVHRPQKPPILQRTTKDHGLTSPVDGIPTGLRLSHWTHPRHYEYDHRPSIPLKGP